MPKAHRAPAAAVLKFTAGAFAEAEGHRQTEHERYGIGCRAGGEDVATLHDESPRRKGTRKAHLYRHERHVLGQHDGTRSKLREVSGQSAYEIGSTTRVGLGLLLWAAIKQAQVGLHFIVGIDESGGEIGEQNNNTGTIGQQLIQPGSGAWDFERCSQAFEMSPMARWRDHAYFAEMLLRSVVFE
jgi:hypothetical protein